VGEGQSLLPGGTVTLLLADVEGSTRQWENDPEGMGTAIAHMNQVVDEAVGRCGGVRPVEQGEGDSFVAAFARARDAVASALAVQRALVGARLTLRMGLHTGDVQRRDEGNYMGATIIRAARIRNLAHGGQAVLSQTTHDLVVDALPDEATMLDLGVHRLKDLSRPERLYQLCVPDLASEFPPLRSLDARRHNLPVQRTTLIGRREEMDTVAQLVKDNPLVTLTGSGGCGKTRLAIHSGAELVDGYPDGVWFADLAAVADPGAVPAQVASVFALKEGPGMSPTEALAAYLGQRRAVLIVDNCEHVVDAVATLADALLGSCPDLQILATSRQPLGVHGEVAWRVPSLPVTDDRPAGIAGVSACEAVQLFAERAGRARPGFTLTERNALAVAEICRRLDGIPLAIELAAARVRVLTPAEIADGLGQRFQLLTGGIRTGRPRQQTLEASVDWSHHLLTGPEQAVFRRLAVFAGSFSFDAAQVVCAAGGIEPYQVLDLLTLLIDKSLAQVDDDQENETRYRLLETIREYGSARLIAAGEDTNARTRHRDHYLELAERAEPHLEGPGQTEWMHRVAQDYPNMRAALAWSRDQMDAESLTRQAGALALFWYFHGPNQEGEAWLDDALNGQELPALLRVKALSGRGLLAAGNFDAGTLLAQSEEGLALARQIGDPSLQSRMMVGLGFAATLFGQPAEVLNEALALADEADDRLAMVFALMSLGVANIMKSPPSARSYFEEAARIAQEAGNEAAARIALSDVGWGMRWQGDLLQAKPFLERAVESAREAGDRMTLAQSLFYLAAVLVETDERAEALETTRLLEATVLEAGLRLWECTAPLVHSQVILVCGDPVEAVRHARDAVARAYVPQMRASALPPLIEAELAAGMFVDAGGHVDELVALSEAAGFRYYLGYGLVCKARLSRVVGDLVTAETVAHLALSTAADVSAQGRIVDALEVLAGVASDMDSYEEAARLLGAAAGIRESTGYARCVSEREADLASIRKAIGAERFESTIEQGHSLSIDGAVAYARRGRGERKRPSTGWASLSPAEIQVVDLVRQGLSNPQIGQRLLCSPRTVQAHLAHVFAKLGVTSRAELAARAALEATQP
jgi:predicted ATPase/class 3 adenylate cyclase/DNA-binding CsgD family transcriptional regulator